MVKRHNSPEHNARISRALYRFYAAGGDRSNLTGRPPVPAETRFWKHVKKTSTCWLWTASTDIGGYGQFRVGKGVMKKAHVFSFVIHVGSVPKGNYVCHSCDVRNCVNPDHLWLGTMLENNRDMIKKGRARYLSGPDNPMFGRGLRGAANWRFGRRGEFWVTNGTINRWLQAGSLIPRGFRKGRVVDWSKRNPKYERIA